MTDDLVTTGAFVLPDDPQPVVVAPAPVVKRDPWWRRLWRSMFG